MEPNTPQIGDIVTYYTGRGEETETAKLEMREISPITGNPVYTVRRYLPCGTACVKRVPWEEVLRIDPPILS